MRVRVQNVDIKIITVQRPRLVVRVVHENLIQPSPEGQLRIRAKHSGVGELHEGHRVAPEVILPKLLQVFRYPHFNAEAFGNSVTNTTKFCESRGGYDAV